jgi:hypothetical protein
MSDRQSGLGRRRLISASTRLDLVGRRPRVDDAANSNRLCRVNYTGAASVLRSSGGAVSDHALRQLFFRDTSAVSMNYGNRPYKPVFRVFGVLKNQTEEGAMEALSMSSNSPASGAAERRGRARQRPSCVLDAMSREAGGCSAHRMGCRGCFALEDARGRSYSD